MSTEAVVRARLHFQERLLRSEGFRESAYQDTQGMWTIGIGRMIDSRAGGKITPAEALFLLSNDMDTAERELDENLGWWRVLDPIRASVLLEMAFNLGLPKLLKFTNTLEAVQSKRWDDAARGMLDSLWADQVGERAVRLAEMMRTGLKA